MNDLTWKYIAFVVAASILIWGVMELNKRLYRRTRRDDSPGTWIKLDSTHPETIEPIIPDGEFEDDEDMPAPDIRLRAQQNGHHSESNKIL